MDFELIRPWAEWKVRTEVNRQFFDAKFDPGSSLTLIGVKYAKLLGVGLKFTSDQPCVNFSGVNGKADGYAFKVPCSSLPLGNVELPCKFIYIPFQYVVDKKEKKHKFRYVTPDKYLVGTDILNEYNISVRFEKAKSGNNVKYVELEMASHGLTLPIKPAKKDTTFAMYAPKVDEIGDIVVECVEMA